MIPRTGVTASASSRNRIAQSPRKRLMYSMGLAPSGPVGPRPDEMAAQATHASGISAEAKTSGLATYFMVWGRMAVSRVSGAF